jgi:MFS family permease
MKLIAWSELDDDERKIASAQMIVLLVCVSPLLGLLAALVGLLFGNRAFMMAYAANPRGVWLGIAWVGLYLVAGILIGARRAIGGLLGLAMFVWSLAESWRQGKLLTYGTAFALLGIVVILRAGSVLGFPFWPKPKPKPAPAATEADPSLDERQAGSTDEA